MVRNPGSTEECGSYQNLTDWFLGHGWPLHKLPPHNFWTHTHTHRYIHRWTHRHTQIPNMFSCAAAVSIADKIGQSKSLTHAHTHTDMHRHTDTEWYLVRHWVTACHYNNNKTRRTQHCRLRNQEMTAPNHFLLAAVAEHVFPANRHLLSVYAETGFPVQFSVLHCICRASSRAADGNYDCVYKHLKHWPQ